MLRRGQRCMDGTGLFPGIHTPEWAFRVYNNTFGSEPGARTRRAGAGGGHTADHRHPPAAVWFLSQPLYGAFITGWTGESKTAHCQWMSPCGSEHDPGTHSSGGGYRRVSGPGMVRLGSVRLWSGSCWCSDAAAATGDVGSLSNWVELERGPAPQQRPRWLFRIGGVNRVWRGGRGQGGYSPLTG